MRKPANRKADKSVRPEFVAAVRYTDGTHELFHVKYADDLEDARNVVKGALVNVRSLLLTERTQHLTA